MTDHQPFIFLLSSTKAVPTLAAAQIQRWALTLFAYDYDIRYKKGSKISNADALSHHPCNNSDEDEGGVIFFSNTDQLTVTHEEIGLGTKFDPTLSKVLEYTTNGWRSQVNVAQ